MAVCISIHAHHERFAHCGLQRLHRVLERRRVKATLFVPTGKAEEGLQEDIQMARGSQWEIGCILDLNNDAADAEITLEHAEAACVHAMSACRHSIPGTDTTTPAGGVVLRGGNDAARKARMMQLLARHDAAYCAIDDGSCDTDDPHTTCEGCLVVIPSVRGCSEFECQHGSTSKKWSHAWLMLNDLKAAFDTRELCPSADPLFTLAWYKCVFVKGSH
jgi:hypothetical protein